MVRTERVHIHRRPQARAGWHRCRPCSWVFRRDCRPWISAASRERCGSRRPPRYRRGRRTTTAPWQPSSRPWSSARSARLRRGDRLRVGQRLLAEFAHAFDGTGRQDRLAQELVPKRPVFEVPVGCQQRVLFHPINITPRRSDAHEQRIGPYGSVTGEQHPQREMLPPPDRRRSTSWPVSSTIPCNSST